jgi:malate/lactate dehydrogenase
MPVKIAILGAAGTLGACTAFRLATLGLADELVLIDIRRNQLKSHLADIETAITGLQPVRLREGGLEDLAGSDIVIVNAGAPWRAVSSRMERLRDNLPLIRAIGEKLGTLCPHAVVITSTNPVDPINVAMRHYSGLPRRQLLGYTLNDTTRFIQLVSASLAVGSTRVQATVIGEHGDYAVLLFSSLRLDGKPINMPAPLQAKIRAAHKNTLGASIALGTGWTSGWTSSVGLARMVAAITGRSKEVLPCSIVLDGELGLSGLSISLPVRLGRQGVAQVEEWSLTEFERVEFSRSVEYLSAIVTDMKKWL